VGGRITGESANVQLTRSHPPARQLSEPVQTTAGDFPVQVGVEQTNHKSLFSLLSSLHTDDDLGPQVGKRTALNRVGGVSGTRDSKLRNPAE